MSQNLSRKELEAAPERLGWQETTFYRSIYLLPSRKKHDSGWHLICIVGAKEDGGLEKAAWCDDINWAGSADGLRMDMTFPSGVVHCWGRKRFAVGASLSSTDVSYGE